MPTTTHREPIAASADKVWSLVGAFGDNSWHGLETTCDGDGRGAVRKVSMPTGVITELCEEHDPATRTMQYGVVDNNPFPVTDYHGRMQVEPVDDASCELTWASTYEVNADADPSEVDADLAVFLKRAARALKHHAESQ